MNTVKQRHLPRTQPRKTNDDFEGPLLSVENLTVRYGGSDSSTQAVKGISFTVEKGETVAVVGESGSGKSTAVLGSVGLISCPPDGVTGRVTFQGIDLQSLSVPELNRIRGRDFGVVFQDALGSPNPVLTVGEQVAEPLIIHGLASKREARARAIELLDSVGIPDAAGRIDDYPHQMSGGMRQRVMMATALSCDPTLLIADEPTTALDVTVQAEILALIKRERQRRGMSVLIVSHDLGVVAGLADRVIVMYQGSIVEDADVDSLYRDPQHPYTRSLLDSIPKPDRPRRSHLEVPTKATIESWAAAPTPSKEIP
ncbi:ABC transporter ATP-binding protein [Brevibacterium sp.]|uniref:ABC transporter ATP-binding protein n=1 Tax=Brevibacterium sp. TaxID=1701 RepID=UPI002810C0E9|nr:ABC transporter ATP-binding protein [Brevibacterium sp.]